MYTQGLDQSAKGERGSRGEETAAQIGGAYVHADVTDPEQVQRAVDAAVVVAPPSVAASSSAP